MQLVEFFLSASFWGWLLTLLLGFGFCLILFFGIRHLFRKGMEKQDKAQEGHPVTAWRKFKKKSGQFFARYGYMPRDPLSRSFSQALVFLQNVIGGRGYRYRLPWFMIIGQAGSGKTTLTENLRLPSLVGADSPWDNGDSPCGWRFFDHGVLLDVAGSLVLETNTISSEEEEWKLLLNLLLNHRPNRPLDGIILTVSAADLFTRETEDLVARSEAIYSKLWQAQRVLGVKLPVFVVVTHCDRVPGFASFCNEIPPENQDDIFGWSNPYPLEMAYKPTWIDEIFQTMTDQLIRLQQEIFTYGKVYTERDGLLLFPREFQRLQGPLGLYLNHLFKGKNLKEDFFFRGVFFSGDGQANSIAESKVFQNLEASFDVALGPAKPLGEAFPEGEFALRQPRTLYFITALFREKIFLEKGLVRFTRRRLLSNNRTLRASQIGVFLLMGGGALGLMHAYHSLMNARGMILPSLHRIGYAIQRSLSDAARTSTDHAFFQQQAQLILQAMTEIRSERLFSPFVPSSWMSPLDSRIQQILTVAYDVVILRAIAYKLREKVESAITGNLPPIQKSAEEVERVTPIQAPSFLELSQYVGELNRLQNLILKYNDLTDTASLQDFGAVVEGLFGKALSADFFRDANGIYRKALSESHIQPIGFYSYSVRATERLNDLIKHFLQDALSPSTLTPQVDRLQKALKDFAQAKASYTIEQLRELVEVLSGTINVFTSPEASWLKQDVFEFEPVFDETVEKIVSSNFFPPSTTDNFLNDCNCAFQKFRGLLAGYRSPLTGPLFVLDGSKKSFVAQSVLNLQGFLNLLLAQPFMTVVDFTPMQTTIAADTMLLWNYKLLYEASTLVKDFEAFFATKLSSLPESSRETLRLICLKGLRKTLGHKIADAQQIVPLEKNQTTAAPEELFLPEVQNLRAIMPILLSLIQGIKASGATELYKDFQAALESQCRILLEKIDTIFESDNPYDARQSAIDAWRGRTQVFDAFGVENIDQLRVQLNLQRQRMHYLAKEFAEPVVQILEKIYEADLQKPPVVDKWRQILTQLSIYQRKGPNTIKDLEDLIADDLPQMDIENCPIVLGALTTGPSDYFVDKFQDIRSRFRKQCKSVNVKASESAYVKIANFFNANLAGRYPFVPKGFTNYPDADLTDVAGFYALFEEQGYYAMELLRLKVKKQPCLRSALTFLNQMDKLRGFFRLLLPQKDGQEAGDPSLPFEVTFRTNESMEKDANQIISWVIKTGGETYDLSRKNIKVRWPYSGDIVIEMRWALGSPYRPVGSSDQPALDVGPLTATFTYKGCWAFLRLLELQKPWSTDFPNGVDPSPTTLRFDIPTVAKDPIYPGASSPDTPSPSEGSTTRVFMSLSLPQSAEGLKNFDLPRFPTEAPSMSKLESVSASAGKTVKKPRISVGPKACAVAQSCAPAKKPAAKKRPPRKQQSSCAPQKKGKKK